MKVKDLLNITDEDELKKYRVFRALSRFNYFPNQKQAIGELPDCFTTSSLTPEVCLRLLSGGIDNKRKNTGFAPVEYKSTRYNNIPRVLSLVHPVAHAQLCKHIYENWQDIEYISANTISRVRPEFYEVDKRIVVMNYDDPIVKDRKFNDITFGKKYIVNADIASCFDSIYSHSIPWAIKGYEFAKNNRGENEWFNQFDKFLRTTKRCETNGMPIGPATSSICLEIILARVDSRLHDLGFEHERYVDDFCCYCSTKEQADEFIIKLSELLAEYRLSLNLRKTTIIELPIASTDDWIVELNSLCIDRYNADGDLVLIGAKEAINIINKAVFLSQSHKDGSVIKFAVGFLVKKLADTAYQDVFECLLSLSFHYPILIPYLSILLGRGNLEAQHYVDKFQMIIEENALHKRSDGMAWPLHIFREHNIEPTQEIVDRVLETKDCVAITILQDICPDNENIRQFVVDISNDLDIKKDEYWLLLYQSYLLGHINNPYRDRCFIVLKDYGVNFFKTDSRTKFEMRCDNVGAVWAFKELEEIKQPQAKAVNI